MEEEIKKAFELADFMLVLGKQKAILQEEYSQSLLHYTNGGTFKITKELLSFVNLLLNSNQLDDVILIDDNNIPVSIPDLKHFFDTILSKYTESSNEYYNKHTQLIKSRKIEKLVDIL